MDGEKLDLPDGSFDAVLCRLGLMYMPHPVTALREWRRVLRIGGRVCVIVFSTPERNGWGAVPVPHHMKSAAEYVQVAREAFGAFNAMMAHLSSAECDSVWNEVERSMQSFESPVSFEAPGECLVGAAIK